ncbi:hypothetical protein [Gordonia terrae]
MVSNIGKFDNAALTSTYEPDVRIHQPYQTPLGLTEQVLYLYGGWREKDGTLHTFERKFIGPMTAGLWLMNARDGQTKIHPDSAKTVRGEVKREYADDRLRLYGAMMEKVGGSGGAFEFVVTPGEFDWTEGDLLDLDGKLVGPGVQIYSPDEDEPILYISELYKVTGKVLGDDVEGFVFYDHSYWPAGRDWKEFSVFKRLQLGWEAFANEFEDGSIEWGHLCLGEGGFNFTAVADQDGAVSMENQVRGGVDLLDEDWAQRARWKTPQGLEWTFELEDGGKLTEFAAARWGGYRAQAGHTRRVGDDRTVRLGFSWLETFGDRLRDNKIPSFDDAS